MTLTLDQEIGIIGVVVAFVMGVAAWLALPLRKWWKQLRSNIRLFLLRRLIPDSPRAEDFPGIQRADRMALDEILKSLPSNVIDWLAKQDFGGSFWQNDLLPIRDFNNKHSGPEFEFLDAELEKLRLAMIESIDLFASSIAQYTFK